MTSCKRPIRVSTLRAMFVLIVSSRTPRRRLADMSSGLEAVNEVLESFEVPVIFITAYPEKFLTGERPEPTFLITKPFRPATVSAVLSQALFFERNAKRRERKAS